MATIDRGQFFLDHHAIKDGNQKAKYFIALTEGNLDDDRLICFVLIYIVWVVIRINKNLSYIMLFTNLSFLKIPPRLC